MKDDVLLSFFFIHCVCGSKDCSINRTSCLQSKIFLTCNECRSELSLPLDSIPPFDFDDEGGAA